MRTWGKLAGVGVEGFGNLQGESGWVSTTPGGCVGLGSAGEAGAGKGGCLAVPVLGLANQIAAEHQSGMAPSEFG